MSEITYDHGQFCWVDLNAHDMTAALEFYGGLFGWAGDIQDTQGGPPYAMLQLDGKTVGGMGEMSDEMKSQGIPPLWNSYINVDDIEAVVAKGVELGAVVIVPVMKVMDAGSLAFLQDPTGAMIALWQADQHKGSELVNAPGSFSWNELATRDIQKACEFYGQWLGWEFEENATAPGAYFMIQNKGRQNGGVMQMDESFGEMPPCWGVYFTVVSADASTAKAQELGATIAVPPFDIPMGRISVIMDPQGGAFSLFEFNAGAAPQ